MNFMQLNKYLFLLSITKYVLFEFSFSFRDKSLLLLELFKSINERIEIFLFFSLNLFLLLFPKIKKFSLLLIFNIS